MSLSAGKEVRWSSTTGPAATGLPPQVPAATGALPQMYNLSSGRIVQQSNTAQTSLLKDILSS